MLSDTANSYYVIMQGAENSYLSITGIYEDFDQAAQAYRDALTQACEGSDMPIERTRFGSGVGVIADYITPNGIFSFQMTMQKHGKPPRNSEQYTHEEYQTLRQIVWEYWFPEGAEK